MPVLGFLFVPFESGSIVDLSAAHFKIRSNVRGVYECK